MEESSSISFWKIAVGILVAAILIGVVFLVARQGKSVANEKLGGIANMLSEYQDETYAMYGEMDVSGAEVRSLIGRASSRGDDICIRVFTKAGEGLGTDYVIAAAAVATEKQFDMLDTDMSLESPGEDRGAASYINPFGVFRGTICRNANGALVGLVFEQK